MTSEAEHVRVDTGEVELDVEVLGPPDAVPILLLSGLGSQRIEWPPELLDGLLGAGLRLIALDNRDAGESTALDDAPGDVRDLQRWFAGEDVVPPYTLGQLAADAVAVLDHLDVELVHVLGRSMGGMVAQRMVIEHPERVASLVSLMSTTGARDVGQPWPEALEAMGRPTPATRDEVIAAGVARARITNSPTLFDEDRVRARLAASYDRAHRPQGTTRQLLAILADGDRTPLLREVQVPTLVIHGRQDALIDVSGGVATADAIPGARLLVLDEMGHDLPAPLLPEIVDAIIRHVVP